MQDILAVVTVEPLGDDPGDQRIIASRLEGLGLHPWLEGHKGHTALPVGVFAGRFPGRGRTEVEALKEGLISEVCEALRLAQLKANVLVYAGSDWGWHYRPVPRHSQTGRHKVAQAPRQRPRNPDSDF